jgi:hypothetical protein
VSEVKLDVPRYRRLWAGFARYPGLAVVPIAWLWILSDPVAWIAYGISLGLLAVAVGAEVRRVRRRAFGPLVRILPELLFLAAVGCLREAGGGLVSGVGILALLPVLQAALVGRDRRELWVILAATAALFLAPILVVGGTEYPHTQYRAGILVVAVSLVIGGATHGLVERVRGEAADARLSRSMLEQVSGLIHELFTSTDVRADLTAGALRIAGASMAILFEHDSDPSLLRSTAVAGASQEEVTVPLGMGNPIGEAFATGQPRLVDRIVESDLVAPELWRACGRPQSALYQPLARAGEVIGVLVVGWQSDAQLSAMANDGPGGPSRADGVASTQTPEFSPDDVVVDHPVMAGARRRATVIQSRVRGRPALHWSGSAASPGLE